MKKFLSIVVTLILIVSVVPSGAFTFTASAETTIVNVYDAQTLETALTTANADVVLWNDITYSSNTDILCHSIDLNGYKLTYERTMTISSSVAEFVIRDSLFSTGAENTGKLTVKSGTKISQGDFIIESGEINISKGLFGDGNFKILDGNIFVYGSNGSNGTAGTDGEDAEYGKYYGLPGSDATDGQDGISGSNGIDVSALIVQGGYLYVLGGFGGNGGNGGDGGDG
ncbi:MAG: hypothetical protein IJO75_02340, partial [Clostridia bacterium]|nr:hypothetical protein [Clostridia bacterium]